MGFIRTGKGAWAQPRGPFGVNGSESGYEDLFASKNLDSVDGRLYLAVVGPAVDRGDLKVRPGAVEELNIISYRVVRRLHESSIEVGRVCMRKADSAQGGGIDWRRWRCIDRPRRQRLSLVWRSAPRSQQEGGPSASEFGGLLPALM